MADKLTYEIPGLLLERKIWSRWSGFPMSVFRQDPGPDFAFGDPPESACLQPHILLLIEDGPESSEFLELLLLSGLLYGV
jgi:hypothetical protein